MSESANKALNSLTPKRIETEKKQPLWTAKEHKHGIEAFDTLSLKVQDSHGHDSQVHTPKKYRDGVDLGKVASGRTQFKKNKLAREIVTSAARVKQIEERPFAGVKTRIEARKHLKQMRKKLKDLDMTEDEAFDAVTALPVEEQAMLASMAMLDKKRGSRAATLSKNIAKHLVEKKIVDNARKVAPSFYLSKGDARKLDLLDSITYVAAWDSPQRATEMIKALGDFDTNRVIALRDQALLNVVSNTKADERRRRINGIVRLVRTEAEKIAQRTGERVPEWMIQEQVGELLEQQSEMLLGRAEAQRGALRPNFRGFGR